MALSSITQREDDGAIPLANNTGLAPGARGTVVAEAMIGDGPFGATSGDYDWYRIDLAAGDVVTASTYTRNFGGTSGDLDTVVTIHSSTGGELANNDDWDGLDSLIAYTAVSAGTYYIRVRDFQNLQNDVYSSGSGSGSSADTGDYRLYINVNSSNVNTGTNGDDTLTATATDSLINGRGGDDTINGGDGDADILDGGAGDDTVSGSLFHHDTLIWTWDALAQSDIYEYGHFVEMHGGVGGDMTLNGSILTMSASNQLSIPTYSSNAGAVWKLYSDAGGDVVDVRNADGIVDAIGFALYGGDGDDTLLGGNRTTGDILDGGSGNDLLSGGGGGDTLYGGIGDDAVDGGSGNDIFRADWDPGNDTYVGGTGSDRLAFNSTVSGVTVDMLTGIAISSETGVDVFTEFENAVGGQGNDVFTPGIEVNTINGNNGIDTLDFSGLVSQQNINLQTNTHLGAAAQGDTYISIENVIAGSNDDALAGDGNDNRLVGNGGNDTLSGRLGNDFLEGGDGNDGLYGGVGNDVMTGGAGADFYNGGGDSDIISYAGSAAGVDVSLKDHTASSGDAVGDTFTQVESLWGSDQNDYFVGDTGENQLRGKKGNDTLYGWTGDDTLNGDEGNDRLFGGAGEDLIYGGAGNDELRGNADADTFVFLNNFGVDTIFDFENGSDVINLSGVLAIVDFTDLQNNHLNFNGSGNAVITDGADVLTIVGLTNGLIDASDFDFTFSL